MRFEHVPDHLGLRGAVQGLPLSLSTMTPVPHLEDTFKTLHVAR